MSKIVKPVTSVENVEVTLNGKTLNAGDAGIVDEAVPLEIAASKPSQVLLFDLN